MTTPSYSAGPWPQYNPYSLDPSQILASMQNNALTTNIFDGTMKTLGAVSESNRLLTSEINGVNKNVTDTAYITNKNVTDTAYNLGVAVERTSATTQSAVERVAGENRMTTVVADAASRQAAADSARDILGTVERTSAINNAATDRNGSQVLHAVERNAALNTAATDRNGGLLLQTIERVAGEGRLTTTVTDGASREAAAGQARDLAVAIERNGANSVNATNATHAAILQSVERNAGESRLTTVTTDGIAQARLADTRRDIISQLSGAENAVLASIQATSQNILNTATNTAWEGRQNTNNLFATLSSDIQRGNAATQLQGANSYASMLLEQQKATSILAAQGAQSYDSIILEDQKNKEHLSAKSDMQFAAMVSKSDGHYSNIMLEQHKVKECLASQAAQNFAIQQLESQKIKESLSSQMAEAKYEALKNKMELSQQLAECCCEIKEKVDAKGTEITTLINDIETEDLRQENTVLSTENFFLDGPFGGYGDYGYGYGRGRGHGHRHGHRGGHRGGHGGRR